jgi:2-polyprenyl-3-methyl-5-hydroxy-6-metoxy-1,4-benzoquinol methylase
MTFALEAALTPYPSLERIVTSVLAIWPQHAPFAARHFASCDAGRLAFLDTLSERALMLIGADLSRYCADYRWMCNFFMKYEMQFRRNHGVEHTEFSAILGKFYKNHDQMGQYMRGLMLSQILWRQHGGAVAFFAQRFVPMLKRGYDYLEIGPGHGLWLSFAATDPRCTSLTAWDVAEASLALTRNGLAAMGIARKVQLELQDVCAAPPARPRFDAAVISQVLELVSSPGDAVAHLAASLRANGLLFVNAPTRLVAPDHIRQWRDHVEVDALLTASGLDIVARDLVTPDAHLPVESQGYSYVAIARKR